MPIAGAPQMAAPSVPTLSLKPIPMGSPSDAISLKLTTKILIVVVTGLDEGLRPGRHVLEFLAHAAAVVDDQADSDGRILVPE